MHIEPSPEGRRRSLRSRGISRRQARFNYLQSPVKTYYTYIMASRSGTLYIGVTSDLEERVYQHKHGLSPGFTSKYKVAQLVYCEDLAIDREKQLKGWSRKKKIALVESRNPRWEDLSVEKTDKANRALRREILRRR